MLTFIQVVLVSNPSVPVSQKALVNAHGVPLYLAQKVLSQVGLEDFI